jgi:hypothetical protein
MNIDEEEFAALRSFTLSPRSTEPMVHMHPTLYSCTSMSTTSTMYLSGTESDKEE